MAVYSRLETKTKKNEKFVGKKYKKWIVCLIYRTDLLFILKQINTHDI